MKYLLFLLLLFTGIHAYAGRHRHRGLPRTEEGLMNNVLGCLANKDSVSYFYLFPPFDTLWALVMHNPDKSPEAIKELAHLREHPQALLQFDPMYNHSIIARFMNVVNKGEDSGVHWNSVVMQRYELSKEVPSRELIGYNRIAPERFKGYLFIRDMLGHYTYCITITEIQKINGYFFGGQVLNILEASTIDQYLKKEEEEKKYFDWLAKNHVVDSAHDDSVKNGLIDATGEAHDTAEKSALTITSQDDDPLLKVRREVVDRKYYEGFFDEEIPVKLFVRYMKDLRTGQVTAYDGLYKFGDQVDYVKLHITRTPDGRWLMEDDPPVGTLDLLLKDKIYTGAWTNNQNQTGYDVELKPADISQHKLEQLDNILEKGLSGRVDEDIIPEKKTDARKEDKDKDEEKDNNKSRKEKRKERRARRTSDYDE